MTKSYVHWLLIIILKSFLAIRILQYKAFLKKKKKNFFINLHERKKRNE